MLKPAEYVAAALRGLSAGPLAGNAAELTHDDCSATVTRVASVEIGEDDKPLDEPAEDVRVLALAEDFPGIRKGAAVELDGDFRLVTSTRADASGASLTIGLSAATRAETVGLSGVRKGGAKVATSVPAYVLTNEYEDPADEGSVSSTVRRISLAVYADALPGIAPQSGDVIARDDGSRFAVKSAELALRLWRLTAREVK